VESWLTFEIYPNNTGEVTVDPMQTFYKLNSVESTVCLKLSDKEAGHCWAYQ